MRNRGITDGYAGFGVMCVVRTIAVALTGLHGAIEHRFDNSSGGFASELVSVRIGSAKLSSEQLALANMQMGGAVLMRAGAECKDSTVAITITTWSASAGQLDAVRISFANGAFKVM